MQLHPITRRLVAPTAVAVALLASAAGSASAALVPDEDGWCNNNAGSQVFMAWADPASYTLAPGGSFENNKSHWTLSAASRDTTDNEPFHVTGASDHTSLSIASGGVAQSPAMCVGVGEPTARVFFKQTGGLPEALLRVDVLFDDSTGTTQSMPIGVLGIAQQWRVSPQLLTLANLVPTLGAGTTAVAFRFTAIGGSFSIDDLYVDPWHKP